MATLTIEADQLKRLIKEAMQEALAERRAEIEETVDERMEDMGLLRAMEEADHSKTVSREEIFAILDAKQ